MPSPHAYGTSPVSSVIVSLLFVLAPIACGPDAPEAQRILLNGEEIVFEDTNLADLYARYPGIRATAEAYNPDPATVAKIRDFRVPVTATVFVGTGQGSDLDYVAQFLKVYETVDHSNFAVRIQSISPDTQETLQGRDANRIALMPSIVLYSGGKEIGSIVAPPDRSIEIHVYSIVTGLN